MFQTSNGMVLPLVQRYMGQRPAANTHYIYDSIRRDWTYHSVSTRLHARPPHRGTAGLRGEFENKVSKFGNQLEEIVLPRSVSQSIAQ